MKTNIVLAALATIAIAVPAPKWENDIKQDPKLNGIFKPINREKKSTVEESVDHESGALTNSAKDHKTHGFRKPILVKKKFGYQIFRDSDEELAQTQPRENCRRQFRFKLCDESGETTATDTKTVNTEDIESDVQHSLKMAKEAVKILQRDLEKIEESTKTMKNNKRDENFESKLHKNIEQAKEASQQLKKNIGSLDIISSKEFSSKESNIERTDSKLEESRMALWKEAIENIQKNVEIVKNMEDTFKSSELSHFDEPESFKPKNVENFDSHFPESQSNIEGSESLTEKIDENIGQDNKEAEVSDIVSYATESKKSNVGLHSDSLKIDNVQNWDIIQNMRHAENEDSQKTHHAQYDSADIPQEKVAEVKSSENLDVLIEEPKSVKHTEMDNFQHNKVLKMTDILEDSEKVSHNIHHEKSAPSENTEKLSENSNNLQDKTFLKAADENFNPGKTIQPFNTVVDIIENNNNEFKEQQKDSETTESKNIIQTNNLTTAKEALTQTETLVEKHIDNEKKSFIESNSQPNDQVSVVRSAEHIIGNANGFHDTKFRDDNQLKMKETPQENPSEKQGFERNITERKESEINNIRLYQYNPDNIHQSRSSIEVEGNEQKNNFEKSGIIETSKKLEHIDSKTSADTEINHNTAVSQKSVDLKNIVEKSNNLAKEQTQFQNNKETNLEQGSNMRFNEFGELNRNLPVYNFDFDNQQRMPEFDFFNNPNSQYAAQLVGDKNLDHSFSHINQEMTEWDRNQQHHHSMLRPTSFTPWMQNRLRNVELLTGNHFHPENMAHMNLDHHDHHLLDSHHNHHHALPISKFFNKIHNTMNHESFKGPMMRDNNLENGGSMDLDGSMQPSMKINMRGALDQSGWNWNYNPTSGKSGFGSNIGSGTVGIFPNANTGCGIPLLLSCSPSVVSGSLAKQSPLGYGHSLRSGDDLRFYTKRDAQGTNDIATTNNKVISTPSS